MDDPFLAAANAWIFSPFTWLGLAVAAFLGVWWAKLTALMSNLTLVFGVIAGAVFVFLLPWVSSQPIEVRFFWSIAALCILSLGAYYTLWTTYVPIAVSARTLSAIQPAGATIGGVPWAPYYTDVRVIITNNSEQDYQDIDLVVRPDQAVTAAGQITKIEGVWISFHDEPNVSIEGFFGPDAERRVMPVIPLASTGGYRMRCGVLPRKCYMEIVMAAVTINDGPPERDGDKLLRLKFESGRVIWYAHPDYSTRVFGPKPVVTSITVTGQYMASQQPVNVQEVLSVSVRPETY